MWVVDPETRVVVAHEPAGVAHLLRGGDELDACRWRSCSAPSPDERRDRGAGRLGAVIRDVVVGRLRDGADEALLEEGLRGLLLLPMDGLLEMRVGRDAGLREGRWDYVITADFADADAYLAYDADEEHNRLRRELFEVLSEEVARVQVEIPDEPEPAGREIAGESSWAADPPRRRR